MSNTDFLVLFQELGLPANCTLDELKLAFRRRVSQLHPDRAMGRVADPESRLQQLTSMYDAALAFHRRYGRMPGYTTHANPSVAAPRRTPSPSEAAATPEPTRTSAGLLVLVALAALLLAIWFFSGTPDEEPTADESPSASHAETADAPQAAAMAEAGGAADSAPASPVAPHHLRLGMSRHETLAIEGEPLSTSGPQWDYGPSWIAFRCGKVSDWYSSPLRPLRTASTHPLSTDIMPPLRAVDCAQDP